MGTGEFCQWMLFDCFFLPAAVALFLALLTPRSIAERLCGCRDSFCFPSWGQKVMCSKSRAHHVVNLDHNPKETNYGVLIDSSLKRKAVKEFLVGNRLTLSPQLSF